MSDLNNPLPNPQIVNLSDRDLILNLQRETFDFFLKEVNPDTGLIADKTEPNAPSSIAVVGMAISTYIAGVERHFLSRENAANRILKILTFFLNAEQSQEKDATGYQGFYYHFLDMNTGKRTWNSELSTIDTAFFIAGALSAAGYFAKQNPIESTIRTIADTLYRRVNWVWALNNNNSLCHGWTPENTFLPFYWDSGYSEAMLMYILALAAPEFGLSPKIYRDWTNTFNSRSIYDTTYIYAGPLFIHQFSHMWIDFRGIKDELNRKLGFDYFENSRRATYVHRQYAIENPQGFYHYGPNCWGLTASDGPGNETILVDGRERTFYDYIARGAPFGPDDGTVSPWAVVASLPFAPEIVLHTVRHAIERLNLKHHRLYGFDASFNPTYPEKTRNPNGWVSKWRFGLNQGPIVLMIENYESELIWSIMKENPYLRSGLKKAGFHGGWLEAP